MTPIETAVIILQGDGKRDEVVAALMSTYGLSREAADDVCSQAQRGAFRRQSADTKS